MPPHIELVLAKSHSLTPLQIAELKSIFCDRRKQEASSLEQPFSL
jgi:hypothetical protein